MDCKIPLASIAVIAGICFGLNLCASTVCVAQGPDDKASQAQRLFQVDMTDETRVIGVPDSMGMKMKAIPWDEIKPIIENFCVWADQPEIGWFRKAWESLDSAGLTSYSNDVDRHWVLLRAIALGIMYDDYCDLEWDEYSDPSSRVNELYDDDTISHVRIGAMATGDVDPDDFDDQSLFADTIISLVSEVRFGVYDALVAGFGCTAMLYAGMWGSRFNDTDQNDLQPIAAHLFDESGFLNDGRDEAFAYVNVAAMMAKDA